MTSFFDKLFNRQPARQAPATVEVKTTPLNEEQLKAVTRQENKIVPPQYIAACGQSVGMQRDHNEDTLYMLNTILADAVNDLPIGIFIVADGMGGHQHGEVASGAAARALAQYLLTHLQALLTNASERISESLQEVIEMGVVEAQQAVTSSAPGGGTTLTAVLAIGDQITLAHVGDSRAYIITPQGEIRQMTQDHSYVKRLIELGEITEEEARVHPQRNVLYRAVGQNEALHPDIHTHNLPRPGYLVLCSDGLWGQVSDIDMFRIIRDSSSPAEACQALVTAANQAGGPDNISVIIVHYPA